MTTAPEAPSHPAPVEANLWLTHHHEELCSRANAAFAWYHPQHREEAVAEVLAITAASAHRAAARGTLAKLTPFWCVIYGRRHVRAGRRVTGSSSKDVMAHATQQRRGVRVVSLEQPLDPERADGPRLADALASREAEDPAAVARRRHDYPYMLSDPRLGTKHLATVRFLAEHHGEGRQTELAKQLRITPGRITQLKNEIADTFATYGYCGPLSRHPRKASR